MKEDASIFKAPIKKTNSAACSRIDGFLTGTRTVFRKHRGLKPHNGGNGLGCQEVMSSDASKQWQTSCQIQLVDWFQ